MAKAYDEFTASAQGVRTQSRVYELFRRKHPQYKLVFLKDPLDRFSFVSLATFSKKVIEGRKGQVTERPAAYYRMPARAQALYDALGYFPPSLLGGLPLLGLGDERIFAPVGFPLGSGEPMPYCNGVLREEILMLNFKEEPGRARSRLEAIEAEARQIVPERISAAGLVSYPFRRFDQLRRKQTNK